MRDSFFDNLGYFSELFSYQEAFYVYSVRRIASARKKKWFHFWSWDHRKRLIFEVIFTRIDLRRPIEVDRNHSRPILTEMDALISVIER